MYFDFVLRVIGAQLAQKLFFSPLLTLLDLCILNLGYRKTKSINE